MGCWYMSDRPDPAQEAHVWLRCAASWLTRARTGYGIPGIWIEHLCFDAQQAAEMALKALLVERRVNFPKTHTLPFLLALVEQAGFSIPDHARRAKTLTPYAVRTRYPGGPPVTEEDYRSALSIATDVVAWVEQQLGTPQPPPPDQPP